MGITFGFVLVGLALFILIRFLVNWLVRQEGPKIVVPPQPKHTGRGRITR